ncbi:LLM class flavin-dependent oxidoreductase [Amycolatopsis sp., V23-08]|uniref:LLM class flavin-dependent oxidoreductase n=1 Tax=Amycolatopsis heterodermiae TaxID=3110235 RepID=A0ABU5R3K6_9PSEU|nr:LLM class flavin-dependent oxidoreductase [Amycolatopsis sp., V23-08]MEA5360280.1 LLM class flavin-dependent oxidoreductase [Amycolatopsis sp., V23-08]
MSVRLGALVLPESAGPRAAARWRQVEQLGFDHAWTLDHLSWRTLRGAPWFDAMTTLTTAAAATSTLRLGTLVASPNFRHPVLTAAQAMALDHASGGRFVLGVGAGAAGPDDNALGGEPLSPARRAERFAEFVTVADRVLRERPCTVTGPWYSAVDVLLAPGCVQRPRTPFAVAAAGPKGMRVAVEFADTWVTIGATGTPGGLPEPEAFDRLRRQLDRLDGLCAEAGRAPDGLARLVNLSRVAEDPYSSAQRLVDLVGRCAELGFTDVVLAWPRADGVFRGDQDAFERAVGAVREHFVTPA